MPSEFALQVYEKLKEVPMGSITTYRDLAHSVGSRSYRAIGQIMRSNPYAPEVPCHRVVASNGTIGGFFGQSKGNEVDRKIAMLASEGVKVIENKIINFKEILHQFT